MVMWIICMLSNISNRTTPLDPVVYSYGKIPFAATFAHNAESQGSFLWAPLPKQGWRPRDSTGSTPEATWPILLKNFPKPDLKTILNTIENRIKPSMNIQGLPRVVPPMRTQAEVVTTAKLMAQRSWPCPMVQPNPARNRKSRDSFVAIFCSGTAFTWITTKNKSLDDPSVCILSCI